MNHDITLFDLYREDKAFKEYVDKYAKAHNKLFPEDCFDDKVVQNYADWIEGARDEDNTEYQLANRAIQTEYREVRAR